MMEVYYQNREPTSSNLDLLRQKYKTQLKMTGRRLTYCESHRKPMIVEKRVSSRP